MKEWREKVVVVEAVEGDEMEQNLLMSGTRQTMRKFASHASIGDGLAFLARHTLTLSALT